MGQRSTADAHHPEQVHVKDPKPLGVVVVGDRALGTDPCVVHHDVEAPEPFGDHVDSVAHRRVVRDIRTHR